MRSKKNGGAFYPFFHYLLQSAALVAFQFAIMPFKLLDANLNPAKLNRLLAKRSDLENIDTDDIASRSPDEFLRILPKLMLPLSSKPSMKRLNADPYSLLDALSTISNYVESNTPITQRVAAALKKHWPAIWAYIDFMMDNCMKPVAHDHAGQLYQDKFHCLSGHLFAGFTSRGSIPNEIYATPGAVLVVVDLWVRAGKQSVCAPGCKGYRNQQAIMNLDESTSSPSTDTITNAIDEIDLDFANTVLEGLRTCTESIISLDKVRSVTEYFYILRKYSRKFRSTFLSRDAIPVVIKLIRKLATSSSPTMEDTAHRFFCISEFLLSLNHLILDNGHAVAATMIDNELLPILLEAIPYVFNKVRRHHPEESVSGNIVRPYFKLLDAISQSGHPAVLTALSKSMLVVKREGYEHYLKKAPASMKDSWSALKLKVQVPGGSNKSQASGALHTCKTCDETIFSTTPIQRCPGCQDVFCSEDCLEESHSGNNPDPRSMLASAMTMTFLGSLFRDLRF
ncbi:hypothetical protein D9758_002981 [Tetrapyrgos nigripes]|uniref:Uncharacterized protein n=1 Tax=Tetrapyrgos nigripes TaxID=182062 RepID=A0A8H5LT38_9AGAR|nr:hypothetical protein D9758_002981 [Tetrapyrgos nigripes]